MKEDKEITLFLCPKLNCSNIPEIIYSNDPFNPIIKYKCNSKIHNYIEEELILDEFLQKSSKSIACPSCNKNLINDIFYYCKNCKKIYHKSCFYNTKCFKENKYMAINEHNLYNTCLEHNNKYLFHCLECNVSFCSKCDLESHNEKGHTLQQILSFIKNQNNKDKIISTIKKQREILDKIKIIFNKLFRIFENDIILKEKILQNYEHNTNNYQYITNFNNLNLKNNEKYENILENIIQKEDDIKNIKFNEELTIDTILAPFYYSMMINSNQNFNNNLINLINQKLRDKNINNENKNVIIISSESNDNQILINKDTIKFDSSITSQNNLIKQNNIINENPIEGDDIEIKIEKKSIIKKKEYEYKEIKNIKQEKSIFNMIILNSGNIATSSLGVVTIYDSNNLLSSNEDNYILQKINICKNKKVSYVFEFPDKTLLCAAYAKIFRLKLIDNDKNYNILGIIELERYELPTQLISLGNSFLIALTELKTSCFLKLFIKNNEKENDFSFNNSNNSNYNEQQKIEDSDDQSAALLINSVNYLNKKKIKKDKEFYKYPKNNINEDKKLLCSLFEIKKDNFNKNEHLYEFIATSNSAYILGDNRIEFYTIQKDINKKKIIIKRIKKIDNISCSIETNSICQFNNKYICIGLQSFNKQGQISGYAIIDINKKEINKIIKDWPISSLFYNTNKKLLFSAMDSLQTGNRHNYIIKVFKIEETDEINLKKIYKIKTQQKDIIMSISEFTNVINHENENENNINIASASMDSTLRIIKILKK